MKFLKRYAAAALAAAALFAGTASTAHAQATPNAAILVVDFERLVSESLAGRDAKAQVEDYVARVQARRQQLADKLQKDQQNLQKQRAILKEDDFNKRVQLFQANLQQADEELRQKQVSAQRAVRQAESEILRQATPIVRNVMKKRRANIVVPKRVVFDFQESLDVTTDVLERLNREVPKLKVALPDS